MAELEFKPRFPGSRLLESKKQLWKNSHRDRKEGVGVETEGLGHAQREGSSGFIVRCDLSFLTEETSFLLLSKSILPPSD